VDRRRRRDGDEGRGAEGKYIPGAAILVQRYPLKISTGTHSFFNHQQTPEERTSLPLTSAPEIRGGGTVHSRLDSSLLL